MHWHGRTQGSHKVGAYAQNVLSAFFILLSSAE